MHQFINSSIHQFINSSIRQSIDQSMNQSMHRSMNESMNESTNEPINQSIDQSINTTTPSICIIYSYQASHRQQQASDHTTYINLPTTPPCAIIVCKPMVQFPRVSLHAHVDDTPMWLVTLGSQGMWLKSRSSIPIAQIPTRGRGGGSWCVCVLSLIHI